MAEWNKQTVTLIAFGIVFIVLVVSVCSAASVARDLPVNSIDRAKRQLPPRNRGSTTTTTTTVAPPQEKVVIGPNDVIALAKDCARRSVCGSGRQSYMNLTGPQFSKRNCFCDLQCDMYGDCCDSVSAKKTGLQIPTLTCAQYSEVDPYNLYYVQSCPRHYDNEYVKAECAKFASDKGIYRWPVSRPSDGLIFANVYCAKCNGVDEPVFWNAEVQCKLTVSPTRENVTGVYDAMTSSGELSRNCRPEYKHPAFKPRYCKPAISACSGKADRAARDKCHTEATNYVYKDSEVYKNKYCAFCNQHREHEFVCTDQAIYPNIFYQMTPTLVNKPPRSGSFAMLLDMNSGLGRLEEKVGVAGVQYKTETIVDKKQCGADEVYDLFARICRRLSCTGKYRYDVDKGECVRAETTTGVVGNGALEFYTKSCRWVQLNSSEFIILPNNSLYYIIANKAYLKGEYDMDGELAEICEEFQQNFTEVRNVTTIIIMFKFEDKVQQIMSTVGIVISLTAMSILIFIYVWKPALRNLPGKIMLCLVSALFIAQLLFLAGLERTEHRYVCLVCAASMHFAFLASFFWMNVMAFDLCRTFSADGYKSADSNKRFIKYSVYAWLCPALIVTSSIVTDVTNIDPVNMFNTSIDLKPGYANDHVCWISNRIALGVWFAAPLALIMAANLVLYVVTIRNIYVVSKMTRQAVGAEQPSRGQFVLFIKLSLVMGLTWLFGFLAAIFEVVALWYVFIVFNTLQGALVAVLFLCTKRVYRLIRKSVRHKPAPGYTSNGTQSSSEATRRTYVQLDKSKSGSKETNI